MTATQRPATSTQRPTTTTKRSDGRLAGARPPGRSGRRLPRPIRPLSRRLRSLFRRPATRHLGILVCYLAAGIAVTWPRATYLTEGKLPATRDGGVYVWDFWWVARQVEHFANPWFTRSIAAPVGSELGYHALMPLAGVVMMPVTVAFGPSASYNLLSIMMPGLLCYAMYRVARLWLRSQAGAIAAGAFFGLSSDIAWHAWYQLNLAAGVLFLPLALEAAVRLRRRPGWRRAVVLGVVVGASLLVDQESAVLVTILTAGVLLSWLVQRRAALRPAGSAGDRPARRLAALASKLAAVAGRVTGTRAASKTPVITGGAAGSGGNRPARRLAALGRKLAAVAVVAVTALVVASPQVVAMIAQSRSGGAAVPPQLVDKYYVASGGTFPGTFTVSPQAVHHGLTALTPLAYHGHIGDGVLTFGLVLTLLTVAGLAVSWRRRSAWLLALAWLGSAALALGATLRIGSHTYVPASAVWNEVRVSAIMPFTWFVQIPGLAGFREAGRLLMLGFVPAALLAGAAVDWLRYHATAMIVPVFLLAAVEAGFAGNPTVGTIPTALPALDKPIAADHSASIVVDVPFSLRGGVPLPWEGPPFNPDAQVLATADGHPRAVGYFSRLPAGTLAAMRRNAFYAGLLAAQGTQPRQMAEAQTGTTSYRALLAAARAQASRMNVGWVLVWQQSPAVRRYLAETGFRFAYQADGVLVYRPAGSTGGTPADSKGGAP